MVGTWYSPNCHCFWFRLQKWLSGKEQVSFTNLQFSTNRYPRGRQICLGARRSFSVGACQRKEISTVHKRNNWKGSLGYNKRITGTREKIKYYPFTTCYNNWMKSKIASCQFHVSLSILQTRSRLEQISLSFTLKFYHKLIIVQLTHKYMASFFGKYFFQKFIYS